MPLFRFALGIEGMKNSDGKFSIGAFRGVKKQYLGGRDFSPIRE